jgi:hypothetical protein
VSDFIPDPPPESPYFDRNDSPYLTYKEAEKTCLQGYKPFQLMSVKIKVFTLIAPLDSIGSGLDDWWLKFLSSLNHKKPEKTPEPGGNENETLLKELKGLYEKETSDCKINVLPVDNNTDWGKVSLKDTMVKKDFHLVSNYKYSIIKNLSVKILIEDFSGASPEIKILDNTSEGVKIINNTITIENMVPDKKLPLSLEIIFPGSNFIAGAEKKGKLTFALEGSSNIVKKYKGKSIGEMGMKEKEIKTFFPVNNLKDKKNFTFHLLYERTMVLFYILAAMVFIFVIIIMFIFLSRISGSGKPVSVSLKMEGMPPVIHTYELVAKGSIDIIGGTFSTPDQFELPNVEGTAAIIHRIGKRFFLVPEKAYIINDIGETVDYQKEIRLGEHFTLRMENMSGSNTDFSFEFLKAALSDTSDELDTIIEEDDNIAGKIDTGDLL